VLLDLLTVFFLGAGSALLWLNLRHKSPGIPITREDDENKSASTERPLAQIHPLLEEIQSHLSEADRSGPKSR
jgi:hypothetical protein